MFYGGLSSPQILCYEFNALIFTTFDFDFLWRKGHVSIYVGKELKALQHGAPISITLKFGFVYA